VFAIFLLQFISNFSLFIVTWATCSAGVAPQKRTTKSFEDFEIANVKNGLADGGQASGMGCSQGRVVLCSQEKRRGAVASDGVYQSHKRHRATFRSTAQPAMLEV
jgi:hypothetical protein